MNKVLKIAIFFMCTVCIGLMPNKVKAASNVTIVIDPGHGGPATVATNLGACYNGLQEKDINLLTALSLKAELEKYGNVTVYLTRSNDLEIGLKERIDFAKLVGADAVVSVHHNASNSHIFYGSEIFVPCSGNNYAKGYGLASCIMKNWVSSGAVDKGIKTRIGKSGDYYGLIRHGSNAGIPTIILEHGYIDNIHDIDRFNDTADYARSGALDAAGIASYYGLKKGTVQKSVGPTVKVKVPSGLVRDDLTGPVNAAMTIDYYNPLTGEVRYTITASETESKCMYYGASAIPAVSERGVGIAALTDLNLWGKGKTAKGTFLVTPGYTGPVYGTVYNNFCLESNPAVAYLTGPVGVN